MPISNFIRILKLCALPLLFTAAVIGLLSVQASLQRKAERAKARLAQAVAIRDGTLPERTLSLKFRDLSAAAEKGDLAARVELGRRYALGQGVKKDEGRAAAYFQGVINEFNGLNARDKRGALVATAFRYMAQFNKAGLQEAGIAANPGYAFSLLHHAASYFGDPAAQCELAKLLMSGDGVTKNPRASAQWLLSASRKGYAPAQALLGELLWRGDGVVKRVPGDGLGLLAIARRNAAVDDKVWISKMFETARAEARPIEILEANAFIVQESSNSKFGIVSDILINGEGGEATVAETGTIGVPPPVSVSHGNQSSLINGPFQTLSGLEANPMALTPNSFETGLVTQKTDAEISAETFQMYRLPSGHGALENASSVRYAGVSQ
jgi:hypothetical protein